MTDKQTVEELEKNAIKYKPVEEALRESEKLLSDIFNSIQDGISVLNIDLTISRVNDVMKQWYSKNLPLEGKKCHLCYHNSEEPCDPCPTIRCIKSGQTEREIVRGLSGSTVEWIELFCYPIKDQVSGEVTGVVEFVRNIAERKQAEKALRESEERYRLLADNVTAVIWVRDMNLKLTYMSPSVMEQQGYTVEEAKDRALEETLTPDSYKIAVEVFAEELEAEKSKQKDMSRSRTIDVEIICKDGSTIWAEIKMSFLRNQNGDPIGIIGITRNITERKQAEEELQKLASVIKYSNELVNLATLDGKMIFLNEAGSKMLGIDLDEVERINIMEVIPNHMKELVQNELLPALMQGNTWEGELQYRNIKTGDLIDVYARTFTVGKPNTKKPLFLANVSMDITDRKLAEGEKKKLEIQLQQAHKMEAIGTLAGGIAHDFNNILSAVIGYTEIALDDIAKGTLLYNNLQEVLIAGDRAKDLVNQILTFARQSDAEVKPTKVSTIAKETLKLIRSTIPASIEIKQNIDSDSLTMANPVLVQQIFMNLYTNANHAMENEGGVLEVNLVDVKLDSALTKFHKGLKPGDYLKLSVSDTGTGISPNIIGLIFEPYFTTKEPGEGTGMGLAMVHGIVKGYDGEITVESKMGKGTVFTVYLPITKKHIDKKPYPVEETPLGIEQILFVDDELPIVKINKQALESLGYMVTTRTSSIEALELFRSKPNDFDLVITDMTMPNMNGDELADELLKIRPDIPVIISTGYSKKISNERAAEIGIKAFAMKPISKTELAKTVRKVLDEPKA
jgi:PAS domain S-box-containing protein